MVYRMATGTKADRMIDLYYFMVMAVALLWIWGFNYAFKEGEILGKPGIGCAKNYRSG